MWLCFGPPISVSVYCRCGSVWNDAIGAGGLSMESSGRADALTFHLLIVSSLGWPKNSMRMVLGGFNAQYAPKRKSTTLLRMLLGTKVPHSNWSNIFFIFLVGMIHVPCSFGRSFTWVRRSGKATLQIIDLTDHAFTKEHQESLRILLCPSTAEQGAAVEALDATLPTPAQLLVAYDVVHTPFSAQGEEYSRRCTLASRSDGTNYPPSRSSPKAFRQIVAAMAATCWEDDHRMWDGKGKHKLLSASWAEDRSRLLFREGFQWCWEYIEMLIPARTVARIIALSRASLLIKSSTCTPVCWTLPQHLKRQPWAKLGILRRYFLNYAKTERIWRRFWPSCFRQVSVLVAYWHY